MAENGSVPEQENPAFLPPLPDVQSLGVGAALRARREQLGWSLADVAAWLRIRESYLEALESGRGGVFPAEAYALGFLRTYGAALGFDASALVVRYKQEGKGAGRKPDLTFPAPAPDRRIPPGVSVSLGLVVIIASYAGWYHFIGHAPPLPEHVPPVAAIIPGTQTSNAPSPQVASILPGPGAVPSSRLENKGAVGAQDAGGQSVQAQNGGQPTSASGTDSPDFSKPSGAAGAGNGLLSDTGRAVEGAGSAAAGSDALADKAPPAPAVPDGQIVVKAIAPSWVQVRDANGKVPYDHVMQAGEQWAVPTEGGPYSLTVGNAGGIVLSSGAITTQPLGRNGAVRRKLVLTADALRDGSVGAATPSPLPAGSQRSGGSVSGMDAGGKGVSLPMRPTPSGAGEAASPAADSGAVGQSQAGGVSGDAPASVAPRPRRRPSPPQKTESSADDLNARQLQGITGH